MRNPFMPLTKDEKKEFKTKEDQAKKNLEESIQLARACLGTEDFQKYEKKYKETKESVIQLLLDYDNPDPVQYAFQVRKYLNDLKAIGTLLGEVEREARRK